MYASAGLRSQPDITQGDYTAAHMMVVSSGVTCPDINWKDNTCFAVKGQGHLDTFNSCSHCRQDSSGEGQQQRELQAQTAMCV